MEFTPKEMESLILEAEKMAHDYIEEQGKLFALLTTDEEKAKFNNINLNFFMFTFGSMIAQMPTQEIISICDKLRLIAIDCRKLNGLED